MSHAIANAPSPRRRHPKFQALRNAPLVDIHVPIVVRVHRREGGLGEARQDQQVLGGFYCHHAIDATPARWRGDAGSSPLDRASTAASSPRNDLPMLGRRCVRRRRALIRSRIRQRARHLTAGGSRLRSVPDNGSTVDHDRAQDVRRSFKNSLLNSASAFSAARSALALGGDCRAREAGDVARVRQSRHSAAKRRRRRAGASRARTRNMWRTPGIGDLTGCRSRRSGPCRGSRGRGSAACGAGTSGCRRRSC